MKMKEIEVMPVMGAEPMGDLFAEICGIYLLCLDKFVGALWITHFYYR